jgi:hypothetical protein
MRWDISSEQTTLLTARRETAVEAIDPLRMRMSREVA